MDTQYEFEGLLVDVKPTNLHGSNVVKAGANIPAGRIVVEDAGNGMILATAGNYGVNGVMNQSVDNSASATATVKPYSFTYFGWVRLTASGAIGPGAEIACDVNGKVKALGAGASNLKIGRAITEALLDGDTFEAFIWVA